MESAGELLERLILCIGLVHHKLKMVNKIELYYDVEPVVKGIEMLVNDYRLFYLSALSSQRLPIVLCSAFIIKNSKSGVVEIESGQWFIALDHDSSVRGGSHPCHPLKRTVF